MQTLPCFMYMNVFLYQHADVYLYMKLDMCIFMYLTNVILIIVTYISELESLTEDVAEFGEESEHPIRHETNGTKFGKMYMHFKAK